MQRRVLTASEQRARREERAEEVARKKREREALREQMFKKYFKQVKTKNRDVLPLRVLIGVVAGTITTRDATIMLGCARKTVVRMQKDARLAALDYQSRTGRLSV